MKSPIQSLRPYFLSVLTCSLTLRRDVATLMNELPVIGYPCLREEFWDRQGANIASR